MGNVLRSITQHQSRQPPAVVEPHQMARIGFRPPESPVQPLGSDQLVGTRDRYSSVQSSRVKPLTGEHPRNHQPAPYNLPPLAPVGRLNPDSQPPGYASFPAVSLASPALPPRPHLRLSA